MRKRLELSGDFGLWTVIGPARSVCLGGSWRTVHLCECACGTQREVASTRLRSGRSKSCGECIPRGAVKKKTELEFGPCALAEALGYGRKPTSLAEALGYPGV